MKPDLNTNISTTDLTETLSKPTILECENLSTKFHQQYAFKDISLSFDFNKIHAIVGPSGCGKTSFLMSINRINQHLHGCSSEGKINYKGKNILTLDADLTMLRRQIGFVFQTPQPFPFSIEKNFTIPLKAHGIRNRQEIADRIEHFLKLTGLWNEVKSRLHLPALALSGGQQQRLLIARTLALEPELVLLDEPCSALDPISTRKIEDLLIDQRSRHTFIVVTHNLSQAKRIADTTTVFWQDHDHGIVLEHNSSQHIFSSSALPLTRRYIQSAN
ncbi:MAG: ATP-binding cassette domain-containing protein [Gammaproteobacteria bacterium]|nr:ATP-binding cassette domain-containing protein [Gammaproteobacteria bacterium]